MPAKRRLKFLFLVVMHHLHVSSIVRSLTGNCTVSCRDPDKILRECKDVLCPELHAQLNRVMYHHNPTKLIGHIKANQHRKAPT